MLDLPALARAKGDRDGLLTRFSDRLNTASLLVPVNGEGEGVDVVPNTESQTDPSPWQKVMMLTHRLRSHPAQ